MLLYPLSRPTCISFVDSHKGKQTFVFEKTISARSDVFLKLKGGKENMNGNGKREMGRGKQGTEEGRMRTKPLLIPYPQTIRSPIAHFLFCFSILLFSVTT